MSKTTAEYGNDSISQLKGADRVRKRPGVIFGSDGLDGCQHAVFEILSNSIDEAREGYGKVITLTRYADKSIEVEDFGRGWTGTQTKSALTGSLFSASCMPAASMQTTRAKTMNTPSA